MKADAFDILERIAETGTAPEEGCSLFGVGYDRAFEQLTDVYLDRAFNRGRSAEKFIIGPFGSGKTHFLRQLMEIARDKDCATSEVTLNRDIDFTQPLLVYREVAREIRAPGQDARGIRALFEACIEHVRSSVAKDADAGEKLARRWVSGLDRADFKDPTYARIASGAFDAFLSGESTRFALHCRWLEGEVSDRALAKELETSVLSKAEHSRFGHHALLSLCQLIRHARFRGTVIGFDEAEQGFSVGKRQFQQILSMLQSSINAAADLRQGSSLIVYAITPDIAEGMEEFAALQQRVADPAPGQGFFDGNPRAPRIDLSLRDDPYKELTALGKRLADLLYDNSDKQLDLTRKQAHKEITDLAHEVADSDAAVSNRRTMAKRTATALLSLYETGQLNFATKTDSTPEEDEV
jgi:hypothetical protein